MFLQQKLIMITLDCDDGSRVMEVVKLMGTAVIHALNLLISVKQFTPDSSLRNLGMVLALLIKWPMDIDFFPEGEDGWIEQVIKLAKEHNVQIKGPYDIEKLLEEREDDIDTDQDNGKKWKNVNWRKEVSLPPLQLLPLQRKT